MLGIAMVAVIVSDQRREDKTISLIHMINFFRNRQERTENTE
jgi:hypothetical protein